VKRDSPFLDIVHIQYYENRTGQTAVRGMEVDRERLGLALGASMNNTAHFQLSFRHT